MGIAYMASRFRNYIQTPALTDISVRFDGMEVYDLSLPVLPDLMAERPLVLFGKYRGRLSGKIEITGNNGKGKFHNVIDAGKVRPDAGNSALRHLWARHKIKMLSDYSNPAANPEIDLPSEITQLGLRYNLLTQYTSFVAIDSVVRNPGGESEQVRQPLPLPEGVSKYAVGEARQGTAQTGIGSRSASVSSGLERVIFVDEAIEIEPPRNAPPPPPPPVIEEVPEEQLLEEEDVDFVDMSVDDKSVVDRPAPVVEKAPPPPSPPPPPGPDVEEIFKVVEEMPRFPGCEDLPSSAERKTCADGKMLRFIYANFKYPESVKESAVSGTVVVQFTVQTDGTISDIEIIRSLHPELDKEALRIFHLMMEQGLLWTPGKQRGRPVKFRYNLPIKIELER
jgi:TonB family protein